MGVIYKITNLINSKVYIGKTIRRPRERWLEHIRESKKENNIPLYNAFRKYGIENFTFEVIEENIPEVYLNEKEKYYIKYFNSTSHKNGYNVALGEDGGKISSKLTEDEVNQIINILLDKDNLISFSKIGKQFNISGSVIGKINTGESWFRSNLCYPLRKHNLTGITITFSSYKNIVKDLLKSNISMKDICKKYNLSEQQLTSINYGKYCYNNDKNSYYYGIYNGDFPIRKTHQEIKKDIFIDVIYDVIYTNMSITKIGEKYGIKGNSLTYIINGKRRKDITKNFVTPLRSNLEINQKIFNELYPCYGKENIL